MNWPTLIGFGLGILRLSPQSFWSMTPRELTAAAGGFYSAGNGSAPPMDPQTLQDLRTRYPDTAHAL